MNRHNTKHILAQEEIELLLNGLPEASTAQGEGQDGTPAARDAGDRIIRGGLPLLERVGEAFCIRSADGLGGVLRHRAVMDLVGVDVARYSELFATLNAPASLTHFHIGDIGGTEGERTAHGSGSMGMDACLALAFVEDLLGGGSTRKPGRRKGYTAIERSVIELVVRILLDKMNQAWKPVLTTHFCLPDDRDVPFPNYTPASTRCLRMAFEVGLAGVTGALFFCLPMAALKPHRHELGGSDNPDDSGIWRLNLSHLLDASLNC